MNKFKFFPLISEIPDLQIALFITNDGKVKLPDIFEHFDLKQKCVKKKQVIILIE